MNWRALCVEFDPSTLEEFADDLVKLMGKLGAKEYVSGQKLATKIIEKYTHDGYAPNKLYREGWRDHWSAEGEIAVIPHEGNIPDRDFRNAVYGVLESLAEFERATRGTPMVDKRGGQLKAVCDEYFSWLGRKKEGPRRGRPRIDDEQRFAGLLAEYDSIKSTIPRGERKPHYSKLAKKYDLRSQNELANTVKRLRQRQLREAN